jgi:hypothetical protein
MYFGELCFGETSFLGNVVFGKRLFGETKKGKICFLIFFLIWEMSFLGKC